MSCMARQLVNDFNSDNEQGGAVGIPQFSGY